MSFVALAIGGGSALSMGGSLFSGLMGSSAQKKLAGQLREAGAQGAQDILKSVTDANNTSSQYLNMARGDLSPFREFGVQAGNTLTDLLMGGGNVANLLKASPLFNFQSQMGSRNLNRELAARGLYGSGAGLQALSQFNDQLVGEEGQRLTDRLFNLTNLGANTASNMAGITSNMGNSMADRTYNGGVNAANLRYNSLLGAANAQAQGTQMLGQMGQSLFDTAGQGLMQYGNFKMYQPLLSSLSGEGGAGGKSYSQSSGNAYSFTGDTGLEGLSNFS